MTRENDGYKQNLIMNQCIHCKRYFFKYRFGEYGICPNCSYYQRVEPNKYLGWLCDQYTPLTVNDNFHKNANPLDLNSYEAKRVKLRKKGIDESVEVFTSKINGMMCDIGVFNSNFMMGSIGQVCGDRIVKLFKHATNNKLPVIIVAVSGGARMQEGIIALMQLQKISNSIYEHGKQKLLYMSVLTDPTMGGTTASLGMQADIILAEKNARIGFAGKRVISQTIHEKISDDLQKSETLLQNGFVDKVVDRQSMKSVISELLILHRSVVREIV